METAAAKNILVLAPGLPPGSVRDLWDTPLLPRQPDLEVLLPPEPSARYDHLVDGKTFAGHITVIPSPARSFFSTGHLKWLGGKMQSADNILILLQKSPYEDLAGALAAVLVMLVSGRTITLLRPSILEHQPLVNGKGKDTTPKWLAKELDFKALGQEYTALFPNLWELVYFFMFWSLALKQLVSDKIFSASCRQETLRGNSS